MPINPSRNFWGYGPDPLHPQWPHEARIVVSLVLNLEEGAELSISDGDERNEAVYEIVLETSNTTDLSMESHFEYGSRVGFWRVLKLFEDYDVQATMNVCGRAVERSPWMAQAAVQRGHELCCHGHWSANRISV